MLLDLLPIGLISFAVGAAIGFERTRRRAHALGSRRPALPLRGRWRGGDGGAAGTE